jgi:hypothetical protein
MPTVKTLDKIKIDIYSRKHPLLIFMLNMLNMKS